jgi:DNA-binding response OmpR family regulator
MAGKILIVEDERAIARALELKLSGAGYDVEVAHNGEEGVQMMGKTKYDLVLLDLVMPVLDGFGVLEKVGNKFKIIVLSNLGQPEDIEKAKALGAIDFFVKSNTPIIEVVNLVKKHF